MYDHPNRMLVLFSMLMFVMLASTAVNAQSGHGDEQGSEEHSFHSNFIGVFLGATRKSRRTEAFTLGLEYNRRFTEHFGMGVLAEKVFADDEFNVYALGFAYYAGPWKVYAAPGLEKSSHHGNEFLLRVGVEYAFKAGPLEISPQIDLDFVGGEQVLVFGVTIGKGF
jgi:hypothetical protein